MVPIDELIGPDEPKTIRDFVGYWASRRRIGIMPRYADIDPIDIPWALSHVYVVEASPDGEFIYRLAGEAIAERYKRPLKGVRISELFTAESSAEVLDRWRRVVSEPTAYYSYTQHTSNRGVAVRARRVILPLGDDHHTADHLIGFTVFEEVANGRETFGDGLITKDVRWADLAWRDGPSGVPH